MHYKNIMANSIALEIIESGTKIPSLPASAQKILAISQQHVDKIDIQELEQLIQKDPVLFAQILNLANSSYYGTGRETVGLRSAIMIIGLDETICSLSRYLFKNALPLFPKIRDVSDKEYWEESWACAVANRRLGDPRFMVSSLPGELYIAGLLQGIGKLILAVYDPKAFYECIKITRNSKKSMDEAEFEIFGTTDALVAQKILQSWNLPPNICAAVGYCQYPEAAEPEYREIAALTQFACAIVKIAGVMNKGDVNSSKLPDISELANTYISINSSSVLADRAEQQKIVQEIISILETQSAATQKSTPKKSTQERDFQKPQKDKDVVKNILTPHGEKKGFFSWIRELFRS